MTPAAVRISQPDPSVPIIASLPHGGTYMPPQFAEALTIPPQSLLSDWCTLELYDFLPALGIGTIEAHWSRFVADANRDPTMPLFAPFWEGIVASTNEPGDPLYRRDPTEAELRARLELAYRPYHDALNQLSEQMLKIHSRILVLDLHCFGMPLPADVIIGDSHGKTAHESATATVEAAFTGSGFSSLRNKRFSGGWIVRQFANNNRIDAIQLELNQRLYLNPIDVERDKQPRRPDTELFDTTKQQLTEVMTEITKNYICSQDD